MFFCLIICAILSRIVGKKILSSVLIGLATGILLVASLPATSRALARNLEQQYPLLSIQQTPEADLIVVLGGIIHPPNGERTLTELSGRSDRLQHAARLWRAGKAPKIFLSGGHVYQKLWKTSESFHARELLVEWGIPFESVDIGEHSKTTRQNATEVLGYLKEKQISDARVLLVTSALHMPRSMSVFEGAINGSPGQLNIDLIPVSTDLQVTPLRTPAVFLWLPAADALAMFSRTWHEYLGLWYYRIRGWAGA